MLGSYRIWIIVIVVVIILVWFLWGGTSRKGDNDPMFIGNLCTFNSENNVDLPDRADKPQHLPPNQPDSHQPDRVFSHNQPDRVFSHNQPDSHQHLSPNQPDRHQQRDPYNDRQRQDNEVPLDLTPKIPDLKIEIPPSDSRWKRERMCCDIMSNMFGVPFIKATPNFLRNPETGRNLEIDCYNEGLRMGVEVNGIQHYVWPNYTGQSQEDFIKQVRRDKFKVDMCDKHGVYLISVPYNVTDAKVKDYITYYLPENVRRRQICMNES